MKGLWLDHKKLQLKSDLPIPEPPAGEALVRVLRAGICNTDLELLRGYYPYQGVLGHEFVGVVDSGPDNLVGRRVVGEINASCGECRFCKSGQPTHCENRTVLGIVNRNGAFAEYLSLPVKNLYPIPESIPTDVATFTEPVAAALEIQEQIKITPNERVLVVGDGKLGQLVAQTLALTGCDLLALGRHREKLDNLEARGIKTGFADALTDRAFDIAVECTGNPAGFAIARRALRPRGILVLKSTYAGDLTIDASSLVVDEITLIGSRCGPFDKAIAALSDNRLDVTPLIHARYPLDDAIAAFDRAQTRGVLKVLLEIGQE
ncbi:MDR/zinc-dependent alcohol dehydrogenase-like family protein [Phormidium sp. CCY1219]|uniref:MDR/zinc-dependent alcohol dehydrogenase-like family protein n=1 Tax=Phormidium sp. CCY1219 TaxID=2886104 RepID=UPI002D1EEC72|nr:alcohol dehydrogenase catalytic domain-containing protein [Phormidium sp. CCY1219]MEB3831406.1 alcohol dehydrogenase catalytic domain-containing protein [Phormidium sp. CCY1219]